MRKTFIFYNDWIDYTEEMTLEESGLFLKTILRYQRGEDIGDIHPIRFIWTRVKKQLDECNEKWEEEVEKRKQAGRLGGIKSGQSRSKTKQNEASASLTKQNEADNVNVNVIKEKNNLTIIPKEKKEVVVNSFEEAEELFEQLQSAIKNNPDIEKELKKFYDYWTAPMKSGKLLWRSQKTFAFKPRLRNWLDKSGSKASFTTNKPSGIGRI